MVWASGVSTVRNSSAGSGASPPGAATAANSILEAYSESVENAITSSPDSASTWNSCDWLPPMAPESAVTDRYRNPLRVKIRE